MASDFLKRKIQESEKKKGFGMYASSGEDKLSTAPETKNKNNNVKSSNGVSSFLQKKIAESASKNSSAPTSLKVSEATKRITDFNTETKSAYATFKNKANGKTTITSNLSDKERKARIKEIESEIRNHNYTLQGLGRAGSYGGKDNQEWLKNKAEETRQTIAELSEELKTLQRVGTFTESELKQFEIEDAKAEKKKLPNYNPTARVMPHQVDSFVENAKAHTELDKEIDTIERQKTLYDKVSKYGDVVHQEKDVSSDDLGFWEKQKAYANNFDSQWRANYRYADLTRDADKAMSEYLRNPTEENREIAYAYDAFVKEYQKNNENALDDENVVAYWLTKSAAGYLPQFKDQVVPELVGGAIGSLLFGKVGGSIGAGLATYSQMYDVTRGSVYRALLAEGVDEQTALEASEDEALISSLIESGGTAISWLLLGGTKALEAIGSAATKSVAKGSASGATKYVANRFLTSTAKKASQPLWKGIVKGGVGIVGNALSEYGEEFSQGAVSRANRERAINGEPIGGKWELIKDSGNVIADAVSGEHPELFSELHRQGVEGFKIGLMFGGTQAVVNNTVANFFNAKTIKEQNEVLDFVRNDEETLDALIEEGKASGEGTVSEKIATEIESAREQGKEVTRDQVKRLIASNDVYIENEEKNSAPATLEEAAMDVVNERNQPHSPLAVRLEALSQNNEPIAVEDVKKVTGFGDSGSELVADYANVEGKSFNQVVTEVKQSYISGMENPDLDVEKMQSAFKSNVQMEAYKAGQIDRKMQDVIDKKLSEKNVVNKESGFVAKGIPSDVTQSQVDVIGLMSKALGYKTFVKKGLKGNAEINHDTGEVAIDFDFEREIGPVDNRQKVSIVFHAAHEIALHGVLKRAPEEGRAFVYELYKHLAGNEPSVYTLADQKRDDYAAQNVNLSLADAMEEVSANNILYLYGNDETKFQNAIERIVNGTNEQAKQGLSKYIDYLKEIIRKIGNFLLGKKGKARAELQAELDEITRLRDMFESAVAKAVKNAKAAQSENSNTNSAKNLEIKTNKEYNESINYSLQSGQYTENEYRRFGWARANNILNEGQNADYRSKFADAKVGRVKFNKSKNGEYIIPVSDIYDASQEGIDNVLVFAKGTITNPVITSVIEIDLYDETNLERIRRQIYDGERRGIQQEAGELFRRYFSSDFKLQPNQQRESSEGVRNSGNNRYGERSGRETSSVEETKVNFSLKQKAPTFYSQMGKTIADMKQDKIGANSVVSYLKGRGIKDEEIKWSGIEEFLEGKKSVTKAELQEFVAGNQLQIETETRLSDYTIDYTEDESKSLDEISKVTNEIWQNIDELWEQKYGNEIAWDIRYNDNAVSAMYREINRLQKADTTSGGFFNDIIRSLNRIEVLERNQNTIIERAKARTLGEKANTKTKWDDYKLDGGSNYRELLFKLPDSTYSNAAMRTHWENTEGVLAHARIQDFVIDGKKMLFIEEIQSDWHNEGHKNGYDDKKKLSVKDTEMRKEDGWYKLFHNGTPLHQEISESFLKERFPNGITEEQIHEGMVTEYNYSISRKSGEPLTPDAPYRNNYHEYVLKNIIRMAAEQGYDSIGWTPAEVQSKRWSDDFAEGYRIEYDQDIPKFLNKYGKKWGAKVGVTSLENSANTKVWSMPITDAMKESVLYEGQPQFSLKDSDYLKAVENGDIETAQKMVDEVAKAKGYNVRAYHGTSRGDRVGNVFLPERATSGPMAFFTDNKEIAEGYSKSKQDTSMAYDPDYDSYETQFRIKIKDRDIPLYSAWGYLPFDARNRITQKAQQLREDWDGDGGFILDPDNREANGGFQWQMKEARGNTLLALNEQWLNSGNLFNEENRYLEVLEMTGVMEEFKKIGLDSIYFKDPKARYEKVYDTYLRITNPFDTSFADNSFVDGLLTWYEEQDESQYNRESMESDLWDKNSIDAYEFADRVRSDIENGTFHAWTSIPDSVTDYLKSLGYDGIKDLGGKNSDVGHTVWIPFSSEQIKSAEPVTYDNNGNVIPLSKRFDEQSVDIRYSLKDIKDKYADKTDHLYIYEKKNTISIDNMVVKKEYRNQGIGTKILKDVIDYADRVQKTITLTPTSEFGTKERLKKWYKANGFVENKGRKTDFTISDTMYRLPSNKAFSLKGTNNISTKDRQELIDIIEHLKGEFEVTKFPKADPKKLSKMTKDLLKEYSSLADFDETFSAIDELYQYMANGEEGHPAVWEEVYSRAYNIAQEIVKNALVVDDYYYQEYKSLRNYLRTTGIKFNPQYDSLPLAYESYNDMRKKTMGRLKFTKDGMDVGEVYQELSYLYPEFFNVEEHTNSADQLEQMLNVLDEIQPKEMNPFDSQINQASMHLANDIASRFFDVPQAKPTFADKAERRVTDAYIKGKKKVDAVRQQKDEKIKKLMETQKEKTKKQLDRVRQQRDAKVKKEQEKRRNAISKMSEKQKAKVLRARIIRETGELNKTLLKGTDKKHIPQELENAVLALLYNINLESDYSYDVESNSYKKNDKGLPTNKTQAFRELKEVYAEIAKNNDYGLTLASELVDTTGDGISNIFDEVMKLSDKKIADMTSGELTKIYDAIRIIEHSIMMENKMFAMQRWENLNETAKAFEKSVATRRAKHALMKKHPTLDIENPLTFFSHFGEAGLELYQALREAQDNEQVMIDKLAAVTQGIVSLEDVQKAEKEIFEFTTSEGKKLTLSKAHIMDIYLLYNRKQGRKHLLYDPDSEHFGNGIHQPEIKGKKIRRDAESIRLSKTDIGNIISKLSESDKAIADKMQKATLLLAEWGNKACMEVFGYEKFKDPDYWTIKSARESINQTPEKNKDIARSIKNMGSAKSVEPKATNSLDIGGIFNVFNQHASDMICYSAWLGVMEDATKLYNYTFRDADGNKTSRTFVSMLEKYAGDGGEKYYFNLLKDIQNGIGILPDTATEQIYTDLYGKAAKAKVAFKLTVVAQQPMAIVRASSILNPLSILQASVKGGVNLPAWSIAKVKNLVTKEGVQEPEWYGGWQRALKYAPIASRKAIGGYEINANSSGLKGVLYKPETKKGKAVVALKESPLWMAGKADEITWGVLWNACEIETNRTTKHKKGSDAYYEEVKNLFTKVINETQVVDGVLQRSQLMRSSSGWVKPLTTFKGEPTMALNGVMRAYDTLRYETDPKKRGKAIKGFSRTVTVFVASAIFTAFARSLAVGVTGEDDEEYWKKVWKSFSGVQGDEETWFDYVKNIGTKSDAVNNINPLSWLPLASEIMSFAQGYDVERLDVASIGEFLNAGKTFINSLDAEGKYKVTYATRNLLLKFAELTGYSPYNLVRDIEGAIRTTMVESDDIKGVYDMEKWRTKPAANTSAYIDILYKAYSTDNEAYDYIYNDMIKNGVDAKKIQSGMETRMKKAEGVEKASELSKRYMTPTDEKKYDSSLSKIKTSRVWQSASATQRNEAKADLYNFLTSDTDDMEKMRAEAKEFGVDETEYTLWQLAIEMADQPKGQKGSGSYDYKEKAEAINSLNLGDSEMVYFFGRGLNEKSKEELEKTLDAGIDIKEYINFKAAVSEMESDKNAKGNSIPGSKKRKVVNYLDNAGLTDEEWTYFYYEIMNYKK